MTRRALRAALARGESQAALAARLGVSRQRIHQLAHPERQRARYAVRDALRSGTLRRPHRCERCRRRCQPQAHHASYAWRARLAVAWLCRLCHHREHAAGRGR